MVDKTLGKVRTALNKYSGGERAKHTVLSLTSRKRERERERERERDREREGGRERERTQFCVLTIHENNVQGGYVKQCN